MSYLKKCKACKNMVSNKAKICPHCGDKLRKSGLEILFVFTLFVLIILFSD